MKIRNIRRKRVKHPMTCNSHIKRCYYDFNDREMFINSKTPTLPTLDDAYAEYLHDKDMSTFYPPVRMTLPLNWIGDNEDIKDFAYDHLHEFCDV